MSILEKHHQAVRFSDSFASLSQHDTIDRAAEREKASLNGATKIDNQRIDVSQH